MQEESNKHTKDLEEKCLSCGEALQIKEIMLWERNEIKCPNCSAPFLIVK